MWAIVSLNGVLSDPLNLFKFVDYESAPFNVIEVVDSVIGDTFSAGDAVEQREDATLETNLDVPLHLLLIQIGCTYGAYIFAKFACKVQIQGFSFALPLSAAVPLCTTLILMSCGMRGSDTCAFYNWSIPNYIFFECPAVGDYLEYLWTAQLWLWIIWFSSQLWITMHIWFPKSPRLASTEQIFCTPMYSSIFIDQSLTMNRRKDGRKVLKITVFSDFFRPSLFAGSNDLSYESFLEELQEDRMDDFYLRYNSNDDDKKHKGEKGSGSPGDRVKASDK